MTIASHVGVKRYLRQLRAPFASLAILLFAGTLMGTPTALAQAAESSSAPAAGPSAPVADEEFSRQLGELKKTFGDVGKQIEAGTRSIDSMKSPEKGRAGIEELRAQVSKLLGTVADNGEVARLGEMALARAQHKIESLSQDTRFKPEEREYLVHRWQELKASTESAIKDLDSARRDFAKLLQTLQTSEDYIDELLQIREHEKALAVIHQLTTGIRDASTKLKRLLGDIKPPSA
jgi:chromosome segregation ATPase